MLEKAMASTGGAGIGACLPNHPALTRADEAAVRRRATQIEAQIFQRHRSDLVGMTVFDVRDVGDVR